MAEQQENHTGSESEDPSLDVIKGNRARGTWALIILIFAVFGIAYWVMKTIAS